jgi:hypothetical protein
MSNEDGNLKGNESGNVNSDESPGSSDTMGAPLVSAPTRHSFTAGSWSKLTAPIRWMTNETAPIDETQQPTQVFFDAVQIGGRKPLTELTPREAWWPVMFGKRTELAPWLTYPQSAYSSSYGDSATV